MKKKLIPVIIAIVLIIVIGCVAVGSQLLEKYSYSKERADLSEYYSISGTEDVAIVLHNEMIEERARWMDGTYYIDLATVHHYFNERFYEDKNEKILLYTVPDDIIKTEIGSSEVQDKDGSRGFDYVPARYEGEVLYIALDYIKQYTNFSYEAFTAPNRLQIDTAWVEHQTADIAKDTAVRIKGGVKSDILVDVTKESKVTLLEQMENWTKVKTADSIIGYVENKRLTNIRSELPIPVTDYSEPEYTSAVRDYRINMGWHVVASAAGNDTLMEVTANTKGLNVISPTWFKLNDDQGGFVSHATADYVNKAHDMGMEVWALIENIEYKSSIDMYRILSSTSIRAALIDNLVNTVLEYGIDGINVDFEQISMDCGEHFIQFIRELSIPCRANGIVLSIDNYVPTDYTDHYNRREQGIVADYVVIMGYDEHYAGSPEAGSVASIGFVEQGIAKTVQQVPAEKVINAVPFFTRIWETTSDSMGSQAVGMKMAEEFVANHNMEKQWDEETCQNYAEVTEDGKLLQVWLEDEESMKAKLSIMDKHKIGGIASWRLGFEKPSIWNDIVEFTNK